MSESVNYVVRNIESSYEIHKSIEQMKETVLRGMHNAVENSFTSWFGSDWELDSDWNFFENEIVGVLSKPLSFAGEEGKPESVQLCLELDGESAIWKLFGINTLGGSDQIMSHLYLAPLLKLEHGSDVINYFDTKYSKELKEKGFIRKGSRKNPYYVMELSFSNTAILKGLENDDWEEALEPLKKSWTTLYEMIDWDDLGKQVHRVS